MRVFDGIPALQAAAGTHLGYSGWHTVTQEQIDTFAEATGDHQWIHVDPEKAAQGPFGTTIAHGFLTLSLVPMLAWQVYTVEGIAMGINYGANRLRFPSTVPAGSRVRAGVELLAVEPSGQGFQAVTRVTVEREGGDKPACVVEMVSVIVPAA
ncbi:MaoC family dehydratase [Tomitella gaofuii]|uniref:MaoC family dehydratase n=1 Tax=Tomitella gaofuii TaxID=2760083 RepID=UPI0015FD9690|nr:MaoC family dehydratase [Tomitella gaofuii]